MMDVYRIDDNILTLSPQLNLVFHTKVTMEVEDRVIYSHREYVVSSKKYANNNVLVKRHIDSYLSLDFKSTDGSKLSVMITLDNLVEMLLKLNYIVSTWLNSDSNVFGFMNGQVDIINKQHISIRCAFDRVINLIPEVVKATSGNYRSIQFVIGDFSSTVFAEKIKTMYHLLSRLDVLTYSNVALSSIVGYQNPINRFNFNNVTKEDKQATNVTPRTFWYNKKSILEE